MTLNSKQNGEIASEHIEATGSTNVFHVYEIAPSERMLACESSITCHEFSARTGIFKFMS